MKDITVSICISVHNTAKYLKRCLDCVCNQSLSDIQIILVNNGSTDNSESIMRDYKIQYSNLDIKIFTQNDLGLAQGRQTGVNHATGEYIAFLDADDLVYKNTYERLYMYAKKNNLDIVEMQSKQNDNIICSRFNGIMNAKKYWEKLVSFEKIPSMLWLRIYKRELFSKKVFPLIYTNNEDMFALPCLVYSAKNIGFIEEVLHIYSTDNENAVMRVLNTNPKLSHNKYENRKKVLLTVKHLSDYIGPTKDEYVEKMMRIYKWHVLIEFLFSKFDSSITYNDKLEAIIQNTGFQSINEIETFFRENTDVNSKFSNFVRIFGIKNVYVLYKMMRRL